MPKIIKATEAVRTLSEILNSVKYHHESYTKNALKPYIGRRILGEVVYV